MWKALTLSFWLFLLGCSPPWGTVTSVEGGYSIKMPSFIVVEQMLPVKTALGPLDYWLVGSDPTRFKKFWPFWSDHGPYAVAHADLPPQGYSQQDVHRLFDHERDRLLDQAKGSDKEGADLTQITLDKPISFRGHPGREVGILFSDARTSHARMYLVEGRFYVLYGMGKDVDTFFNSFTLLGDTGG
jgi:hypothetical protein